MKIAYVPETLPKISETSTARQKAKEGFSLDQSTRKYVSLLAGGVHSIRSDGHDKRCESHLARVARASVMKVQS
jgi:hypothetical protein